MIAGLLAALLAAPAATVALLPLDNLSGDERAGKDVAAVLARALTARGYTVADAPPVEAALEAARVRYLDSLPGPLRATLAHELGAGGLLTGAVYTYVEGPNPMLAFSGRLVSEDGAIRWAGVFGLGAAETEGMFGAGRASTLDALLGVVAGRVLRSLPAPGAAASPAPPGKPLHLAKARAVPAAALGAIETRRVAVLPPESFAEDVRAAGIVAHLLAIRLRDAGFEPVEAADLREAMRAEGLRSFRALDSTLLAKVGERVGTRLFLSGTVYAWRNPPPQGGAVPPEVSLELTLVDVASGRVLWSGQHARTGNDYAFFLQRGALSSAVALADRVVAELLDSLRTGRPPARTQTATSRRP
jgi:hypothetical protein